MNKISQKSIIKKVEKNIIESSLVKKGERITVALSGGADSISLLEILLSLKNKLDIEISACHFNHKLRGDESDRDEEFVLKNCQKKGIACYIGRAVQKNIYKNEEEARNARYAFFEKILEEGRADKIALAHNLNDLDETFLMRIIRGSGLKGLSSIPVSREKFIRPLLYTSRREIEDFLKSENIKFIIDKTNLESKYFRNQIRLDLIPYLQKYNKNIVETLGRAVLNLEDDYSYLQEESNKIIDQIAKIDLKNKVVEMDHKKWLLLHPAMQKMVLRGSIERIESLIDISTKQIDEIEVLLKKGIGRKHKLLPHSLRIELSNGRIVISKI